MIELNSLAKRHGVNSGTADRTGSPPFAKGGTGRIIPWTATMLLSALFTAFALAVLFVSVFVNPAWAGEHTQEQIAAKTLPEFKSITGLRNPFLPPVAAPDQEEEGDKEIYFDGTSASMARLPGIRVTGFMEFDGKIKISADVEGLGPVILQENDQVILHGERAANTTAYFKIIKISKGGMTLVLDDGARITGKYY